MVSTVMPLMIKTSTELGTLLKSEAARLGLAISHDTHYDARNWQLSWWRGKTLHRLDFQPLKESELAVTHYKDHFKLFPRLLRWAHDAIPLFPYLARIEWSRLETWSFPLEESCITKLLADVIKA